MSNGIPGNGATPSQTVRALRIVFFGLSIVSDWGNPAAFSQRALLRTLAARGHQVHFLEERRNRPTVELLEHRGGATLREFDRHYPDISHRTFEIPALRDIDVWLGREAATADAIVVFDGTPLAVVDAIRRMSAPHALQLIESTSPSDEPSYRSRLTSMADESQAMPCRPIISPCAPGQEPRDIDALIVAYDQPEVATQLARAFPQSPLLAPGEIELPGFETVSEITVEPWYRRATVTLVVDRASEEGDPVRALLPVSFGSPPLLVVLHEESARDCPVPTIPLDQVVAGSNPDRLLPIADAVSELSTRYSATHRANELEALIAEHKRGVRRPQG